MKILFVSRKMDNVAGGVERMMTAIMNDMIRRGHDVSLFTWDQKGAKTYYKTDSKVNWHMLDMGDPMEKANITMRWKRLFQIRKVIKADNPNIIICFQTGIFLSIRLYLLGLGFPIVAAERNALSELEHKGKKQKILHNFSVHIAQYITVQFPRYIQDYPARVRRCIKVISNPVKPAKNIAKPAGNDAARKILLNVGRIAYQKNIDVLIDAFKQLCPDFPAWDLVIAGQGDHTDRIQEKVSKLATETQKRITLLGAVEDVSALYQRSHLFCLSSRWEGFPNALGEAMAHGLPAAGYKGCDGVCDLIIDGKTGLLARGNGNVETLAESLRTLMNDDALREKMGAAAIDEISQYKPDIIFDEWDNYFKKGAKE